MEDWQQRVIGEKRELDEKIGKLRKFMHSETYALLGGIDASLLASQEYCMSRYSDILKERIDRFN